MAVLGEELLPHLRVALLHARELDVDLLPFRVGLLARQHQVQVRGVQFVLPVVQPGVEGGFVDGRHGQKASRNSQNSNWLDGVAQKTSRSRRRATTSRVTPFARRLSY